MFGQPQQQPQQPGMYGQQPQQPQQAQQQSQQNPAMAGMTEQQRANFAAMQQAQIAQMRAQRQQQRAQQQAQRQTQQQQVNNTQGMPQQPVNHNVANNNGANNNGANNNNEDPRAERERLRQEAIDRRRQRVEERTNSREAMQKTVEKLRSEWAGVRKCYWLLLWTSSLMSFVYMLGYCHSNTVQVLIPYAHNSGAGDHQQRAIGFEHSFRPWQTECPYTGFTFFPFMPTVGLLVHFTMRFGGGKADSRYHRIPSRGLIGGLFFLYMSVFAYWWLVAGGCSGKSMIRSGNGGAEAGKADEAWYETFKLGDTTGGDPWDYVRDGSDTPINVFMLPPRHEMAAKASMFSSGGGIVVRSREAFPPESPRRADAESRDTGFNRDTNRFEKQNVFSRSTVLWANVKWAFVGMFYKALNACPFPVELFHDYKFSGGSPSNTGTYVVSQNDKGGSVGIHVGTPNIVEGGALDFMLKWGVYPLILYFLIKLLIIASLVFCVGACCRCRRYRKALKKVEEDSGMTYAYLRENLVNLDAGIMFTGEEEADDDEDNPYRRTPPSLQNQFRTNTELLTTESRNRRNPNQGFLDTSAENRHNLRDAGWNLHDRPSIVGALAQLEEFDGGGEGSGSPRLDGVNGDGSAVSGDESGAGRNSSGAAGSARGSGRGEVGIRGMMAALGNMVGTSDSSGSGGSGNGGNGGAGGTGANNNEDLDNEGNNQDRLQPSAQDALAQQVGRMGGGNAHAAEDEGTRRAIEAAMNDRPNVVSGTVGQQQQMQQQHMHQQQQMQQQQMAQAQQQASLAQQRQQQMAQHQHQQMAAQQQQHHQMAQHQQMQAQQRQMAQHQQMQAQQPQNMQQQMMHQTQNMQQQMMQQTQQQMMQQQQQQQRMMMQQQQQRMMQQQGGQVYAQQHQQFANQQQYHR